MIPDELLAIAELVGDVDGQRYECSVCGELRYASPGRDAAALLRHHLVNAHPQTGAGGLIRSPLDALNAWAAAVPVRSRQGAAPSDLPGPLAPRPGPRNVEYLEARARYDASRVADLGPT